VGVPYYVVFDPLQQLQAEMDGALLRVWTILSGQYVELTAAGIEAVGEPVWLENLGLGLVLWEGEFEEAVRRLWLRWCDAEGQVILTGAEGQAQERQRAERLAAKLRELNIDPDAV
jgi:hypothetical protein